MKRITSTLLTLIFLFLPFYASAEVTSEEEQVQNLYQQVLLLIEEVNRLQELITQGNVIEEEKFLPPKNEEMREIISYGVEWFKEAQETSGHFAYEYMPYEDKYIPKDNIVRQAGGLYALGEVAVHDDKNKLDLKETLQSGVRYFDSLSVYGNWNGYNFRCISNSSLNETCQLGATSLALVGLIDMVTKYPELRETYDELIHDYGKYIIAMKKDGSGFRHGYLNGSEPSENESSFSNGEALLALVRYYMYEENGEVKKILDDVFEYIDSEQVPFDFPLYLWAMAAIKDMYSLWPQQKYVEYVDDYTAWRIRGFAHRKGSSHNMCAYVEGVISAYSVLEGKVEEGRLLGIQREINYWLNQSKDLQITQENKNRIIQSEAGAYFGKINNMKQAGGGFLTDQYELTQRIDFTQHCINSYLQQLVDINRAPLGE